MVNFPSRFVFNRRSFRNGIQSKDMFNAIRREFLEGHLEDGVLSERATKLEGENDGEPYNAKLIWQIRLGIITAKQEQFFISPYYILRNIITLTEQLVIKNNKIKNKHTCEK